MRKAPSPNYGDQHDVYESFDGNKNCFSSSDQKLVDIEANNIRLHTQIPQLTRIIDRDDKNFKRSNGKWK